MWDGEEPALCTSSKEPSLAQLVLQRGSAPITRLPDALNLLEIQVERVPVGNYILEVLWFHCDWNLLETAETVSSGSASRLKQASRLAEDSLDMPAEGLKLNGVELSRGWKHHSIIFVSDVVMFSTLLFFYRQHVVAPMPRWATYLVLLWLFATFSITPIPIHIILCGNLEPTEMKKSYMNVSSLGIRRRK